MTTEHDRTQQQNQQYGQLVKLTHDPAAAPDSRLERFLAGIADFTAYYALPWLRRRGREIEAALLGGWDATAAWLRALAYLAAFAAFVGAVNSLTPLAIGFWKHTMVGAHHDGVIATVTRPVHDYLTAHTAGLPTDAATVWALWQIAGPVLLITGWIGFTSARTLWLAYGAATALMVWSATPEAGRVVATGLAITCWVLLSTIALYGLRLRPSLVIPVRVRVKPKITVKTGADQPKPSNGDTVDRDGDVW